MIAALGLPTHGMVQADFAVALAAMCAATSAQHVLAFCKAESSLVTTARNHAVRMARENGAEWILFLDGDMIFPPDTYLRLIAHNKDIVGATYRRRYGSHDILGSPMVAGDYKTGLIEALGLPTGCLLIKTSVFDKFDTPYFRLGFVEGQDMTVSEDYIFSMMAREKGFQLWLDVDLSAQLGHIGSHIIWTDPDNDFVKQVAPIEGIVRGPKQPERNQGSHHPAAAAKSPVRNGDLRSTQS